MLILIGLETIYVKGIEIERFLYKDEIISNPKTCNF